jgi:hypothetical protein
MGVQLSSDEGTPGRGQPRPRPWQRRAGPSARAPGTRQWPPRRPWRLDAGRGGRAPRRERGSSVVTPWRRLGQQPWWAAATEARAVRVWKTLTAPIYNGHIGLGWAIWAGQPGWAGVLATRPLPGPLGRPPVLFPWS